MRQSEVWIGGFYRTKVGNRITRVKVERNVGKRGRSRDQFECVTADTGKVILRTAAKLRPMVDVAKPAPAKRELVAYPDPDMIRHPGLKPMSSICAQPIGGVVNRITWRAGDIVELDEAHARWVRTRVDRLHVSEPLRTVARSIRSLITMQYRYLSVPRALRRGLLYAAAKRHAANRNTYRMVMGEHPFPSEEMIGRAILGTQADRDRLLRHVDELRAG
jgi:hypothetical protein